MFGRTQTALADAVDAASPLASELAEDEKLRRRARSAIFHAMAARNELRPQGTLRQLMGNQRLHAHLRATIEQLEAARAQVQRKRRRQRLVRMTLLALPAAAFAVPASRTWLMARLRPVGEKAASVRPDLPIGGERQIVEQIEVGVPVSTAYNQWTQFEEFPLFMEGVDDVRQLDDTRLHWVASIGGSRAEWDAKIIEQLPDERISWTSESGQHTRGEVSFESLGHAQSRIRLTLTYTPEGINQALGSAVGMDARRVRGDLERFKQLIESRGVEDGAWRGEVHGGQKTSS